MALGTSCPLHNWVSPGAGECLWPSGQGRAPTLRPRRRPQAMRWGNAYSAQAGRVRSKGTGLGGPSTQSSAGQAHSNPMGLPAVRGQGRAGSRTQGQVQGFGEGADPCCPLLSLIHPNNPEEGLRGSSRAQSRKLRVESGVGVSWPSGWGRHCCVLASSSPGLLQRHSGSPQGLIHFQDRLLGWGPQCTATHSQEQARQTRHACP